ncbi:hypothetical protein [Rickettsia endosymbiont of Urophora cardui]|uniref:hypothetical protein n=1 Tax=Rickettsia endosymbiont of Urophora cardui TaxID=3066265 RepID=UPI00313E5BC6
MADGLYSEHDFDQFCTKFKLITNYENREELSDSLKNDIKLNELVHHDAEIAYTMYYNALHKWCSDRVGTIYQYQEAKALFNTINDTMQLPVMYGISQAYFASPFVQEDLNVDVPVITEFLSTANNTKILYLNCDNITLGHITIVQYFQKLVNSQDSQITYYTASGYIFARFDQFSYIDSYLKVANSSRSKCHLIVVEVNATDKNCDNIKNIIIQHLKLAKNKIIILYSKNTKNCDNLFKDQEGVDSDNQNLKLSFSALDLITKQSLLNKELITLHGSSTPISLNDLIQVALNTEHQNWYDELIDNNILVSLLTNQNIEIGLDINSLSSLYAACTIIRRDHLTSQDIAVLNKSSESKILVFNFHDAQTEEERRNVLNRSFALSKKYVNLEKNSFR